MDGEDRPLVIIRVQRLGPASKDQDQERRPTMGVGSMVNADYLVSFSEDSNDRYKAKILFSLRGMDEHHRTATIVMDGHDLTIEENIPTNVKSTLYGSFELTLLEFTSRAKLHREAAISI
jgi:hypothetical protein